MGNRTQRLLLWCAATDSTFELACSNCNQGKGRRLDPRRWEDETRSG